MIKLSLIFLLFSVTLFAKNDYDLRVAYCRADANDFGEVISSQIAPSSTDTNVLTIDAGYKIADDVWDLPFDIYVKGGFARFFENSYQKDVYENTLYIKGYYNFDFWQNSIRFGAAEGASYTYGVIYVEKLDAQAHSDNNSHVLNYIELTLDFDLGKLIKFKPLEDTYVGAILKHRSGVFGLINNVRHGGSNYDGFYIEKNF